MADDKSLKENRLGYVAKDCGIIQRCCRSQQVGRFLKLEVGQVAVSIFACPARGELKAAP